MTCAQTSTKHEGVTDDARLRPESSHDDRFVRLMSLFAFTVAVILTPRSAMAQEENPSLPYVTIDHPQFISASEAGFLSPRDLLIGVSDGKTSKAYPAAILAQHGVVQDHVADGPIAVTW